MSVRLTNQLLPTNISQRHSHLVAMSNDVEVSGPTALKLTSQFLDSNSLSQSYPPPKKNVVSRPEREAKISSYKFFLDEILKV